MQSEELIESDIVTLERALRSLADLASSVLRADEMMGESKCDMRLGHAACMNCSTEQWGTHIRRTDSQR